MNASVHVQGEYEEERPLCQDEGQKLLRDTENITFLLQRCTVPPLSLLSQSVRVRERWREWRDAIHLLRVAPSEQPGATVGPKTRSIFLLYTLIICDFPGFFLINSNLFQIPTPAQHQ